MNYVNINNNTESKSKRAITIVPYVNLKFVKINKYSSFKNKTNKEQYSDTHKNVEDRFNYFINKPEPHSEYKPIRTYLMYNTNTIPDISIIMPIYNQQDIIKKNATSIFEYTTGSYEVIFIIDSCSDNTENMLRTTITELPKELYNGCTSIVIHVSDTPLFETSCDNIGLYCAKGTYAIEIQADMEMVEHGYNEKLIKPFFHNKDIIGISGRCSHGLKNDEGIGKLGLLVEQPLSELINKNAYYIGETCNRGPLALDILKVRELGYFDEVNFFLDDSDHDLFARAYHQKKWLCGYVPIEVKVSLANGSTRKGRDPLNQRIYESKKQVATKKNGFLYSYVDSLSTHRPIQMISYI